MTRFQFDKSNQIKSNRNPGKPGYPGNPGTRVSGSLFTKSLTWPGNPGSRPITAVRKPGNPGNPVEWLLK